MAKCCRLRRACVRRGRDDCNLDEARILVAPACIRCTDRSAPGTGAKGAGTLTAADLNWLRAFLADKNPDVAQRPPSSERILLQFSSVVHQSARPLDAMLPIGCDLPCQWLTAVEGQMCDGYNERFRFIAMAKIKPAHDSPRVAGIIDACDSTPLRHFDPRCLLPDEGSQFSAQTSENRQ